MMRILHLDSGREMRGGQWQVLRLHRGLVEAGHESLLLARENSPLLKAASEHGLPADVLRPLRLAMQSRRFDIVHAHDAHSHTLGAVFARVPLVVSRRVAFAVKDTTASRWKYQRPRLFIAVSRFVAAELRRAGVEDARIVVIPDGVPVPGEPASGDAILVLATNDPAKGLALAEAAAELAEVNLKRSKDLEADLPHARALIYISHSEGLGSGILLAMAHGVTVVASEVGGIPELIEDGVNGVLAPNNVEAIAGAFRRINPRLGQAARQTVIDRFTVERMVHSTAAAYRRVLADD